MNLKQAYYYTGVYVGSKYLHSDDNFIMGAQKNSITQTLTEGENTGIITGLTVAARHVSFILNGEEIGLQWNRNAENPTTQIDVNTDTELTDLEINIIGY